MVNARTNHREVDQVADEVRALGRKAQPLLADVGDKTQLERLLNDALSEFGHIDVVVNNAAARPHKPFVDMSYEDWRGILPTDLDSAFLCTLPHCRSIMSGSAALVHRNAESRSVARMPRQSS